MLELSTRQFFIVRVLNDNPNTLSSYILSSLINISQRTLRYEINNINKIADHELIRSNKDGYYINKEDKYSDILKEIKVIDSTQLSKITAMHLLENHECSIYDLAQFIYSSDSTALQIVKSLTKQFGLFNLTIVQHGEMIRVEGNEADKRRILSHYFFNETNTISTDLFSYGNYFTEFKLSDISKIVTDCLNELDNSISEIFVKNIVINVAICFQRVLNGQETIEDNGIIINENDPAVLFLRKVIHRANDIFGIDIGENDFKNLYSLTSGTFQDIHLKNPDEQIDEIKDLGLHVRKALDKTFQRFKLDVDYDTFLDQFILHVHYLLKRSKSNSFFKNDISSSLRFSHPFIYEMSVYLSYQLEKAFKIKISDDEIGLIAIYLGTVIFDNPFDKARIVIIVPNYHRLREKIQEQLMDLYSNRLVIVASLSSFSEIPENLPYDMIISCVENNRHISRTIEISPLITKGEIQKLDNALVEFNKIKKQNEIRKMFDNFFEEDLFFYNASYSDRDAILQFLTGILKEKGYVSDEFIESVYKREEISPTCFFQRFAIPHSLDVHSNKTKVIYYYREDPIQWGEEKVNLVVLLISSGNTQDFSKTYNMLFDILLDISQYYEMIENKTYTDLLNFFSKSFK